MSRDHDVQRLLDKDAIRDLLYRYCRGIDRWDFDLVASCFHPDAVDDHGRFIGAVGDFIAYMRSRGDSGVEATQHRIDNLLINLDGDRADSEAYYFAYHIFSATGERPKMLDVLAGRWLDRIERRNGSWRIARRIMVKDWRDRRPIAEADGDRFQLQHRGPHDPSYAPSYDDRSVKRG